MDNKEESKKTNNITKSAALEKIIEWKNAFPPHVISELICRRCFYGDEYEDIYGKKCSFEMSYICRAYNITEYGTSDNRIRKKFRKYAEKYDPDLIGDVVSQIVRE